MTDIDIKIQIASKGTNYIYTLSPGCTITRSSSKNVSIYPIEGGKPVKLMAMGKMESDTIRIDAKCSSQDTGGDPTQPPYVPFHTLFDQLQQQDMGDISDVVVWGDHLIYGRIKSIVVTQRPGEGNLYDLSITFLIGTPTSE